MTYFITAFENTTARLIASETTTTSVSLMRLIVANLEERGFLVTVRAEG
jgi:hypothetical protein